jgi:heme-degrading monooxygenase HmoA
MIVSMAVLTIRKGHLEKASDIIHAYVEKEKKTAGVVRAYVKKALNNDDTFLIYVEYDTLKSFQAAEKASQKLKENQKVEFELRPHLLRGFYGNFN